MALSQAEFRDATLYLRKKGVLPPECSIVASALIHTNSKPKRVEEKPGYFCTTDQTIYFVRISNQPELNQAARRFTIPSPYNNWMSKYTIICEEINGVISEENKGKALWGLHHQWDTRKF